MFNCGGENTDRKSDQGLGIPLDYPILGFFAFSSSQELTVFHQISQMKESKKEKIYKCHMTCQEVLYFIRRRCRVSKWEKDTRPQ